MSFFFLGQGGGEREEGVAGSFFTWIVKYHALFWGIGWSGGDFVVITRSPVVVFVLLFVLFIFIA